MNEVVSPFLSLMEIGYTKLVPRSALGRVPAHLKFRRSLAMTIQAPDQ